MPTLLRHCVYHVNQASCPEIKTKSQIATASKIAMLEHPKRAVQVVKATERKNARTESPLLLLGIS